MGNVKNVKHGNRCLGNHLHALAAEIQHLVHCYMGVQIYFLGCMI